MQISHSAARRLVWVLAVLAGLAALAATAGTTAASAANGTTYKSATFAGTGSLSVSGSNSTTSGTASETPAATPDEDVPNSGNSAARVPSSGVPTPAPNPLSTVAGTTAGWDALSHYDQRTAGTGSYAGTQFSLEPPDQALCVGAGHTLEGVNDALQVFNSNTGAAQTVPVALNQFYGLHPSIVRSTPPVFGDFTSDPKCVFDPATQRFFVTILEGTQNSSSGALEDSAVYLAVSKTSDPTKAKGWTIYKIDTTNDGVGGTSQGCPCLGDQPLIAADAHGFYITTNSFPLNGPGFNGAQIYAVSKAALESGVTSPTVVHLAPTQLRDGIPYSIQPAMPYGGGSTASNSEYFLSALDFNATLDNQIAEWTLTGTSTLETATPKLDINSTLINTEVYGQPPAAEQENTAFLPLRDQWLQQYYGVTSAANLELLNSNDDRMNQVVLDANGNLWGALNTVVKTPNGPTHSGWAWFAVKAGSNTLVNNGYVSVNQENLLFPSIGIAANGRGVIGGTLVGTDTYPSAAWAPIDAQNGAGTVHVAAAGYQSNDGFTGYKPFGGTVARWGDYSAAAVDPSGSSVWLATEYVSNRSANQRTLLANWGTYVWNVTP